MITRPNVEVNGRHEYFLISDEGKEKLQGVSTVAKVGEDEVWGMAGARGFRIGYEGAFDVLTDGILTKDADHALPYTKEWLREQLIKRGLTPWHKTDKAKQRGNNVHDALEQLAQKGQIAALGTFAPNERPFVQALARWYLEYRPKFEATEVQVVSSAHKFAGRYDIRAIIEGKILLERGKITPDEAQAKMPKPWLTLNDLKTGKGVYPTSHFPQLAGYELAGTEMGYPKTDAQFILNCKEDGTYEFARSNATAHHFLSYLAAHRDILDLKKKNPKPRKAKA